MPLKSHWLLCFTVYQYMHWSDSVRSFLFNALFLHATSPIFLSFKSSILIYVKDIIGNASQGLHVHIVGQSLLLSTVRQLHSGSCIMCTKPTCMYVGTSMCCMRISPHPPYLWQGEVDDHYVAAISIPLHIFIHPFMLVIQYCFTLVQYSTCT